MLTTFLYLAVAITGAAANQAAYAQCGGQDWTESTTCVSGYTCKYQNAYYSQCLPGGSDKTPTTPETKSSKPTKTPKKKHSGGGSSGGSGKSYKASFTEYGSGDDNGSGNCNTDTTACGFFSQPGYSAAASQNLFGVGPGAGAGPGCGKCFKLTIETDSSGNKVTNAGHSIVVQVTNLCPADGNPLCAQNGLSGTNQYGANVNFDLCINSGASDALFGGDGVGLGVGTAEEVSCSEWSGTIQH